MFKKMAAMFVGLAIAGVPALAQHHTAVAAAHKTARGAQPKSPAGQKPPAPIAAAYAAMPEAQRLSIQSDLAWLGYYEGPPGSDFDERTIDAVKAYQKANRGKDTGVLTDQERTALAASAQRPQTAVGWRLLDDPATGTRLGIPGKLVSPGGAARTGSRWASGRGQIEAETFRLREANLGALFEEEKRTPRGRTADWSALGADSFVVSGMQGLKFFIVRAQASGGEVRGITVMFDQATEGVMRPAAIAMADSFVGFPDPAAALPAGQRRSVEYGTAIVADAKGDLLAIADVTSGCDVIMVPGFGHADRIAEDAASDLALIRLYGARNLTPAPLAGDSPKGANLKVVGITAPTAQQGGNDVTSVASQLEGQNIAPAPGLGFSGAAAVDAEGHFAGMVALKSPAVLVPADTVRAFLAAHRIVPSAGQRAMDQSVVRLICVRK